MKLKILFVCPCWPGLIEAYNEGIEPNGMPGFYELIKRLVEDQHEVDLFIYTPKDIRIGMNHMAEGHWFSKIRIVNILKLKEYRSIIRVAYDLFLLFRMNVAVSKTLKISKYDLVYGQGNYSECSRIAALNSKVPFAMRKYGDDFVPLLRDSGRIIASLRSPISAFSYLTKKEFILATNDGTSIDVAAKRFRRNPPYDIYVWNNGCNTDVEIDDKYMDFAKRPFIFQFSRIMRLKGQSEVVDAFSLAKEKGYPGDLVIAGTIDDKGYYDEIVEKIKKHNLQDCVHFIGKITPEQTKYLSENSVANILSGINYNLNNVFIESLGYGAVVIVKDTPLIRDIITNGENGFIYKTIDELSEVIIRVFREETSLGLIRQAAITTCLTHFGTWEKRIGKEVDLLLRTVERQK